MGFFSSFFKKSKKVADDQAIDYSQIPNHVAIIMDGNGRWAKRKKLPRIAGHREGAMVLKKIVAACDRIGIKYLTVYAFSTENWKRPPKEVEGLMSLLLESLKNADKDLAGKNVRIQVIGNVEKLSEEMQKEIIRIDNKTKNNTGICLNIALNYGGRDDIVNAVKKIAEDVENKKIKINEITEDIISQKLYTVGIPDPDLVIRTSDEKRISNFLLWQVAYSEFWYTEVLWPDFREEHVLQAIKEYQNRNRRFGGV